MNPDGSPTKAKLIIALIIGVLILLTFVWAMFLILTPIDEAQRSMPLPAQQDHEQTPVTLPVTGYDGHEL